MDAEKYLHLLKEKLLNPSNFKPILIARSWAKTAPEAAGVYALKENGNIVYVGETGNLQGRMYDLLDSRQHTVRRTIGERLFVNIGGFEKATTRKKFPIHIEELVNDHICVKLSVAYIEVSLGRKELEELIEGEIEKNIKLNKRSKRKLTSKN
ncbi:MAG: hypothetical protein EOO51_11470 [Flavobacterium sp.]|nr:MAG: hypothetical protein EOO51_11470 [Flavobacterium sp.]